MFLIAVTDVFGAASSVWQKLIYYLDELQASEDFGTLIFFEAFSVLVLQHLQNHYTVTETEIVMN
jgi:hypothetical protein